MRETRYAVMALAEAFPRPEAPRRGWANRDDGPARLPRTDSLVHTLDDLENLWDVPEPDRARFAQAIRRCSITPSRWSEHRPRPASAVWDRPSRPRPWSAGLTIRPRSSGARRPGPCGAWGTRVSAPTRSRRRSRTPTRGSAAGPPGSSPINSRAWIPGVDVPESLIELTRDPDLWTRLQALRTLRQWFYRTKDTALARRIVDTYLARMAEPDAPVVRKNLSEGLYIMLDENLGGGVSLQKNIESLPAALRPRIMDARRAFERDVLITPVLAALERGNDLQRVAVLEAFDGSFFKGRSFARQPEGMIDVGNDREFGFLYQPDLRHARNGLRPALFAELPAKAQRQALQLASFFKLPGRTRQLLDPDGRCCAGSCLIPARSPRGGECHRRRR